MNTVFCVSIEIIGGLTRLAINIRIIQKNIYDLEIAMEDFF